MDKEQYYDHAAKFVPVEETASEDLDEVDRLAALMLMLMTVNGFRDVTLEQHDGLGGRYYGGCETAGGKPISITIGWTE